MVTTYSVTRTAVPTHVPADDSRTYTVSLVVRDKTVRQHRGPRTLTVLNVPPTRRSPGRPVSWQAPADRSASGKRSNPSKGRHRRGFRYFTTLTNSVSPTWRRKNGPSPTDLLFQRPGGRSRPRWIMDKDLASRLPTTTVTIIDTDLITRHDVHADGGEGVRRVSTGRETHFSPPASRRDSHGTRTLTRLAP